MPAQGQENSGIEEPLQILKLNLKEICVWAEEVGMQTLQFELKAGPVYVKDLEFPEHIHSLNPDHYLCTVNQDLVTLELVIDSGYGYVLAENHDHVPEGYDALDTIFSPITRVEYYVSNARIGQRTDYDKLTIEVWTNGALTPQQAIVFSAQLFREQMTVMINFKEEEEVSTVEEEQEVAPSYNEHLDLRVSELDLPVRAANCLRSANITYIGQLVQKTEKEMVEIKNFGRKSLADIYEVLKRRSLNLGMSIPDWTPPN